MWVKCAKNFEQKNLALIFPNCLITSYTLLIAPNLDNIRQFRKMRAKFNRTDEPPLLWSTYFPPLFRDIRWGAALETKWVEVKLFNNPWITIHIFQKFVAVFFFFFFFSLREREIKLFLTSSGCGNNSRTDLNHYKCSVMQLSNWPS